MIKTYILMLLLICTFCCATINQGVVIDKWYEPRTYLQGVHVEINRNNDQIIRKNVSYRIKDGEDYCIMIMGTNIKGKEVLKVLFLKPECWDSVCPGQYFYASNKCFDYDFTYEIIGDLNTVTEN